MFLCVECQKSLLNCEKAQKQFNQLSHDIISKVKCAIFKPFPQPAVVLRQQSFAGAKKLTSKF